MKKLQIIRDLLAKIVADIDAGNSNLSESQYDEILEQISFFAKDDSKYSKYQSCKFLNVSRATFDNYVRSGLIPKGRKQIGFTEKFWYKSDLEKVKDTLDAKKSKRK